MGSDNKKQILLMLPKLPYPIRADGLSIRYFPIIEYLSEKYIIDIIIITKEKCNLEKITAIRQHCRSVTNITYPQKTEISRLKKYYARAKFFLPWSLPRSWVVYGGELIKEQILKVTSGIEYSTLICVSGYVYPFIDNIKADKIIVDFIDSPSIMVKRNVIGSSRSYLIRKYEAFKTYIWESRIIRKSDVVIYISNYDAMAISKYLAPIHTRKVIPNGFSANDYTDELKEEIRSPSIGFLGNMSYFPNIEAVNWLYFKVFLTLKSIYPDLTLYIIGREPDDSIRQLEKQDRVFVTGEVKAIWPYVNSVDIFVFPLMRGVGLKNKILEAMYAGKPVVTTTIGNEGIGANTGEELFICQTPEEYFEVIASLLESASDRKIIGEAGREYICINYLWSNILVDLENIIFSGSTK